MKLFFKQFGVRAGNTLLLAMLIMSGIIAVSTATSRLILNEFLQSLQLDKATVAFYAAEAGVEKSLFEVRKKDFSPEELAGSGLLSNQASYELITKDNESVLYASLDQDETYQLDLFDNDSLQALSSPIRSIRISWEGPGSYLEVTWRAWKTDGSIQQSGNLYTDGAYISQASSPYYFQFYDSSVYLYRVRISARGAAVNNMAISAYGNLNPVANCNPLTACQVSIPGRVSIKAIGEYPDGSLNASRQAILTTMPQTSPLAGLYDYVLFSEEEIKKEN
jgi:hypothetical protein